MPELLVRYRSPNERRIELALGYVLGLGIALGLREFTNLPHIVSVTGVLVGILISGVALRIFKRSSDMLPAAEALERRGQNILKQNLVSAIAERSVGIMILITTVILLTQNLPTIRWLAYLSAHAEGAAEFAAFFILVAVISAWHAERRWRRHLLQPKPPSASMLAEALSKWRWIFLGIAGILIVTGCAASGYSHRFPWPTVSGLLSAVAILLSLWIGRVPMTPGKGDRFRAVAMAGILLWGVPMGVLFSLLATLAFGVRESARHHSVGAILGMAPKFLVLTIPTIFGIGEAGGLGFGLFLGAYLSMVPLVSVRNES